MSADSGAYLPRVVDAELEGLLRISGAVLIEGPKACGKTETGRRVASSEVRVDVDPQVPAMMAVDPALLLSGGTPRLIDEWQGQPQLWNVVRRAVDDRQGKGQFILTGSAQPVEDARLHSGAGRIARLRMRPMTLWESGQSSGEVSLWSLLAGERPSTVVTEPDLPGIIDALVRGGWPSVQGAPLADARTQIQHYVDLLAEVDISAVSNRRRDPNRVRQLLSSLARSSATESSISTLATDVGEGTGSFAWETIVDYLDALSRLMVVEDAPAWSLHLRSSATLRKAPKRHFVDPSLAVAALGAGPEELMRDLNFTGQLFESLAVRDLRVYGQRHGVRVFHARDSSGREADAVLQRRDGAWMAVEIKLGPGAVDHAASSLLRFAENVDERTGECLGLLVVTGWGLAHRRDDGVNVVPLTALRD
ncbi:ATP-binding protein [Ruania alba]|uniref:ATP-binding protein n=1 Tax=Ruania alba TaxID=648782 RepID=A0A1H5CKP1_9MICO|nr:DUF4143 domain-containing protein [Ruania alba]SED66920.1 hypothetical protein SAMN04488554_0392 [Ruania alba]